MCINNSKGKKDQTGTGKGKDKMLHANPKQPLSCPILCKGLWIFVNNRLPVEMDGAKVFQGPDQKHRYASLMEQILSMYPDAEVEIVYGASKKEHGTHSNRKGALTFGDSR